MIFGINIKILLGTLAGIMTIGIYAQYFHDIFKKKTKPHAYSWLIWTITQGTALVGLWIGRGGWGSLSLLIGTTLVFLVFLLSLKYGTRNITKIDTIMLIAALLAILIWWQLRNPFLAISMVSIIDFLGFIPSFRKTYIDPWTETALFWAICSLINIITILALQKYNFLTLTYLITITTGNMILLTISLVRRHIITQNNLNTKQ